MGRPPAEPAVADVSHGRLPAGVDRVVHLDGVRRSRAPEGAVRRLAVEGSAAALERQGESAPRRGLLASGQGRGQEATAMWEQSLRLFRELGDAVALSRAWGLAI